MHPPLRTPVTEKQQPPRRCRPVAGKHRGSLAGPVGLGGRILLALLAGVIPRLPASATTITLRSGFQLRGRVAEVASVSNSGIGAGKPDFKIKEIYIVDDGLRRVFLSAKQVQNNVPQDDVLESLAIEYNRAPPVGFGRMVASIGSTLRVSPFDEYGRRIYSIAGPQGQLDIVQGITEVNSRYVKIEGLLTRKPYTWDMRVATSSIPRSVLTNVMRRQINDDDPDERLKLFRLYTEAELYRDAKRELESLLTDFPDMKRLQTQVQALNQLRANRLVRELERLSDSGQHSYAYRLLKNFRSEGVAAETLLRVRDMIGRYETQNRQRQQALKLLDQHVGELKSAEVRRDTELVVRELKEELNVHNLARVGPYLRLADDPGLTASQKVSLALSGWLMGADRAQENMAESAGLSAALPLVREYLQTPHAHVRENARSRLETLEGVTPENLAAMIETMKPVQSLEGANELGAGFYEVTVPGPEGHGDFTYVVQLPPEYSPHRKYPCIVTLHGGTTAEMQVDFWAGARSEPGSRRRGQATRYGYIVIAPKWTKPKQRKYEFSFREHAVVLTSLRDAFHRLSIDTDRVFLTGHSLGGDAAWDIALAHPDLWAGVVPIAASADKYVSRYWPNAKGLPLYFVTGDMDASRADENAREWDRYLKKPGFDCIVAEYQGRGHEAFPDEIQHLFRWMELQRRDFGRREFSVVTMREWDNFFWFLEVDGLPPQSMVPPVAWPVPKTREAPLEARVLENNRIILSRCPAAKITVYLSPDWVDFTTPSVVTLRSRRFERAEPEISVILEDTRTRGDRQHPFWAKTQQ